MNAWKLRFSMVATLAAIFGLTTLVFAVVLTWAGFGLSLYAIAALVLGLNVVQWLLSPYLVGAIYRAKELKEGDNPKLHQMVTDLSIKSRISKPKLMLAQIPLPNAFAYGSPLTGNRVAVTQGLLSNLDDGEVEAVIGHELGHLKHRDVQVMMAVSFLPALFYYIGYVMLLQGMFGGERKSEGGNNALIGIAFMAFSWVLTLFTLYLSRIREYYADRHSVQIVENGAQKLSTGLVTIVEESKRNMRPQKGQQQPKTNGSYKALFIADPDRAAVDSAELHGNSSSYANKEQLLRETLSREPTSADRFSEIFSTHPNLIKRLRALQELKENPPA
ncbi:MAG: zinc metalloprotease HtpX [Candidatus Bathyarchaeota archaeon]|nr:zinc metalloprotease HtpX [Candidatus Bathyarchaeota archaeon]